MKEEMQNMNRTLKKIDEGQNVAAAQAKNPLPIVQATSSRAWMPLLNDFVENVQPVTDRWRSTLDTVLIFVSVINSENDFAGISADPAIAENEAIANLTNIYVQSNNINLTSMNLPQPQSFAPTNSSIWICSYWSLSLVVSVSIACLAVTLRGFVGKILRSNHISPHKKLVDYQTNVEWAERVLRQVIEFLPQLLAIPVLLFLLGFLNMLILAFLSNSSSMLILVAVIISLVSSTLVCGYTIYLPFNKAFQNPTNRRRVKLLLFWLKEKIILPVKFQDHEPEDNEPWTMIYEMNKMKPDDFGEPMHPWTEVSLYDEDDIRFYARVCATHNDDAVERAAAAIPMLIDKRRRSIPGLPMSPSIVNFLPPAKEELSTILYLLSREVSLRANLAGADILAETITLNPYRAGKSFYIIKGTACLMSPVYVYSEEVSQLINALLAVANRLELPHRGIANAIARLLHFSQSGSDTGSYVNKHFEYVCSRNPFLALLAVPYSTDVEKPCVVYAFHGLVGSCEPSLYDWRDPTGQKEDELLFNSLSHRFLKSFRVVFIHHIDMERYPCMAYLPEPYVDSLSTCLTFQRWLYTCHDNEDISLFYFARALHVAATRYEVIISQKQAEDKIYRTVCLMMRNLAETALKTCSPDQIDFNLILKACVTFSRTFILNVPAVKLHGLYEGRLPTFPLVSLLNQLKASGPLHPGLSDEVWHSLYASASRYPPRISLDPESDKAYIMRAFRQFVPLGKKYDLMPENERHYPLEVNHCRD
ncbi:hypothetical protein H0H93_003372 [Arthromyces matolae]|nr:hypothetical protein H0H93_003372 [Arthromyces matolae]